MTLILSYSSMYRCLCLCQWVYHTDRLSFLKLLRSHINSAIQTCCYTCILYTLKDTVCAFDHHKSEICIVCYIIQWILTIVNRDEQTLNFDGKIHHRKSDVMFSLCSTFQTIVVCTDYVFECSIHEYMDIKLKVSNEYVLQYLDKVS